jgi:hypothetical protein
MRLFCPVGPASPLLHLRTSVKQVVVALVVFTLISASVVSAQSQAPNTSDRKRQVGTYKMIAGGSLAALGGLLMAVSHESASITTSLGTFSASATNKGGLVTGIGMLGAGGYLLYLGSRDRKDAGKSPSQTFAVEVGKRNSLLLVRQW